MVRFHFSLNLIGLTAYSIKREIGHLCHDERRPKASDKQPVTTTPNVDVARTFAPGSIKLGLTSDFLKVLIVTVYQPSPQTQQTGPSAWPMTVPQGQFLYQPETLGNEFSVLRRVSTKKC